MPILSNFIAKIVSLFLFVLTTAIKVVSVIVILISADSICLYGGHLNDEAAMHLQLVAISLISDIMMILCIVMGIPVKLCNMGADPATIIYNFVVGLLTICGVIPYLGVTDCKSKDFSKIKMIGFLAPASGLLHIINAILGFLSLSKVESSPPVRPMMDLDGLPTTSSGQPGKSTKSATSSKTPAKPSKTPAKSAKPPPKPPAKPPAKPKK